MTLASIRDEFEILSRQVNDKPLIYFDNAATSQKPKAVLAAMNHFYTHQNANVHRGVHTLSVEATDAFDRVRAQVAQFLGFSKPQEVIFTKGATEAVNLVAESWGRSQIEKNDSILVSRMEHHANFVPWQSLCLEKGAQFHIAELDENYEIDLEFFEKKVTDTRPKIVALTWMSNVLGGLNPIYQMVEIAKAAGARVFIDATQGLVHSASDLSTLGDIDFACFSAHKIFGPTGVGVLWGKESLLKSMPPYQLGGDMILSVEDQKTTFNELPYKFEAGTPNIAGVIGLGAALQFIESIGRENILRAEEELTSFMLERLAELPGLKLFGPKVAPRRGSIFSFELEGIHPHDLATFLDAEGIAVRAGHHCAQPLMRTLGVPATTRASLTFYNTSQEIEAFIAALRKAQRYFQ